MGWNTIETPVRTKGLASMTVSESGKVIVSLPANRLGAWDKAEALVARLGNGDDFGKLLICPASEGDTQTFGRAAFATHSILRIPGWNAATRGEREKVTQVAYEVDGPNVIIVLPDWARGAAEPVVERKEWAKQGKHGKKKVAEPSFPKGEEDKQPAPAAASPVIRTMTPAETDKVVERLRKSKAEHETVERLVTKNGAALGHKPNAVQMRQADRQTEAARRLPSSKASETETPPPWRGKPDMPVASITKGAKVNMVGHIVEAGGRAMTLKGDEIKLMAILVGATRPVGESELQARNVPGVVKSINSKIKERKLPLAIIEHNGRYSLET